MIVVQQHILIYIYVDLRYIDIHIDLDLVEKIYLSGGRDNTIAGEWGFPSQFPKNCSFVLLRAPAAQPLSFRIF